MITEKENIIKLNETVQKNKNYQIDENRKISRRIDELESEIKLLRINDLGNRMEIYNLKKEIELARK